MRRHAKASSAFTFGRSASAAGHDARSFATRGASRDFDGSGAPALGLSRDFGYRAGVGAALLALALLSAMFFAVPASATKYVDRIAGTTTPLGGEGGDLSQPRDIAVNVTGAGPADAGDFYFVESAAHRVQRFDAAGNFERAWGANAFGRDEVQAVTINATAGTFTLTVEGSTTAPIPYNADSGVVDNALDELPSIGGDANVDVEGGDGVHRVRFTGPKGGTDWPQITADSSGLSGGAASASVATLENGTGGPGANFEICTTASLCHEGTASGGNPGDNLRNGAMNGPHGVVVNQTTGDVYVRDRGNNRVNQYDGDGNFIRSWGFSVDANVFGTGFEICPATNRCTAGTTGSGNGQFGSNSIDSGGIDIQASTGDVFVVDPQNRRIQRFQSNGVFVSKFGSATNFTSASHPRHVAVAPNGIVYATDGAQNNEVERYDLGTGTFLPPLPGSLFLVTGGSTATVAGLEFDPGSGRLLVARLSGGTSVPGVFEVVNPSTATASIADNHVPFELTARGLGFNSVTGDLLLSGNFFGVGSRIFIADDDGAPLATVTVQPPTAVTARTATLHGEVTSPDQLSTDWELQVSPNGSDWLPVSSGTVPPATSAAVTGDVVGLAPNTEYRVRIISQRQFGNPKVASTELTFLTDPAPPEVRTTSAEDVSDTGATVTARINAHSTETAYHVEWGEGTFANVTPVPDAPIGSGPSFVNVSQPLSGLVPGTTYQFRFVATSVSEGTTTGPTMTFTTLSSGTPASSTGRSFELVSPADKVAGIGTGSWYGGPGAAAFAGMPAFEGERFAAQGEYGSMLMDKAAQAYVSDWAFAERLSDSAGWVSHSPITHPASGPQDYRWLTINDVTPDFSRLIFKSNGGVLRPFPEMAGWSENFGDLSFLGDWVGRWEIFGPTAFEDPNSQFAHNGSTNAIKVVLSEDGSTMVGSTTAMRGLAGPGDPTLALPPNEEIRNVYMGDASNPADSLPGTGPRVLASVCAGSTEVPAVDGSGNLSNQACPDGSLVSPLGATQQRNIITFVISSTSLDDVVSRDGSRVFFMSPDPKATGVPTGTGSEFCDSAGETCPPQLYVRQRQANGDVVTRWISRSRSVDLGEGVYGGAPIAGQDATLLGQALYEGASDDGDKVFFRTNSPLTPDDPNGGAQVPGGVVAGNASSSSWDLYMYDFPDAPNSDPGDGTLTRVSAGPTGASDANNPQSAEFREGSLRFASDDASRVYFATAAPLAGVAPPANGTATPPGGTASTSALANLYAYDASAPLADRWRFVARLSRGNGTSGCATSGTGAGSIVGPESPASTGSISGQEYGGSCVNGTSDGSFITFFTGSRLLADDLNGYDIYAYDADRDDLTRVTAPQGGVGAGYACGASSVCYGDVGFYYDAPGATLAGGHLGLATDPLVAGERLVFFQSASRLVAADTDAAYDVYQWRNGKLSLLTPGDSDPLDGQMYKGTDTTGRNVYFATQDQMSWQDYDAVLDVYSARVGNGVTQPPSPPPCTILADACQSAQAAPPAYSGAGSAVFSGDGNVVEKKKPKKSKKKNKGKKKKKGKGKSAKRANHDRRANR